MLKAISIIAIILAIVVAASGYIFVNSYNISVSEISVIEAAIMQISHTRYLISVVLALMAVICYASQEIISSQVKKDGDSGGL